MSKNLSTLPSKTPTVPPSRCSHRKLRKSIPSVMYSIMVRSVVQSYDEMETGEAYEGCWRVVWFGLDLFESEIVLIDWYSKKTK